MYSDPTSTLHDRTHKGLRQAGNTSVLAFNSSRGIPGYTGYTPRVHCIPVNPSGSNVHAGKVLDSTTRERVVRVVDYGPKSTYNEEYRVKEGDVKPFTKTGGGYWIRTHRQAPDPAPLSSTTTYRSEMFEKPRDTARLTGTEKLPQAYQEVDPLSRSISSLDPARGRANRYVTTYASMTVKNPLVGGAAAAGRPRSRAPPPEPRPTVAPREVAATFSAQSSYKEHHGEFMEDPMSRMPAGKQDYTLRSSTRALNAGTSRGSRHIPGYAGHISQNGVSGVDPRPDGKAGVLLHQLDQYSRDWLPGYGGHRPQAPGNLRLDIVTDLDTTQGRANRDVVHGHHDNTISKDHCISSAKGTGSFFAGGGLFVSANGTSNAERYFHLLRPMDGAPRLYYPSRTTAAGYKFPR
ncbi:unnamed protein product [Pedinophyceae sp. YPF-701]|nr:unnamed protein product [Pedinophyceae sp. YPF-701]